MLDRQNYHWQNQIYVVFACLSNVTIFLSMCVLPVTGTASKRLVIMSIMVKSKLGDSLNVLSNSKKIEAPEPAFAATSQSAGQFSLWFYLILVTLASTGIARANFRRKSWRQLLLQKADSRRQKRWAGPHVKSFCTKPLSCWSVK